MGEWWLVAAFTYIDFVRSALARENPFCMYIMALVSRYS